MELDTKQRRLRQKGLLVGALSGADGESLLAEAEQPGNATSRSRRARNIKCRATCFTIGVLALVAVAPVQSAVGSGPQGWPKPFDPDGSTRVLYEDPTVALGANGYAIWAWWEYPSRYAPSNYRGSLKLARNNAKLMVRIRLPGKRGFEPAHRFGRIGSTGPKVAIARNGQTVLSWVSPSNRQVFAYRRPGARWHDFHAVAGPGSLSSGRLSVGPDGTAAMFRTSTPLSSEKRTALVTARTPSGRFGPWQRVDSGGDTVGNYAAVSAGRGGRATVVWGSPCPLDLPIEEIDPARYVDVVASSNSEGRTELAASQPEFVPDSKCPTFNLDLAARRPGGSVPVGGWLGENPGGQGGRTSPAGHSRPPRA